MKCKVSLIHAINTMSLPRLVGFSMSAPRGRDAGAAGDAGCYSRLEGLNRVAPAGQVRFGSAVAEGEQKVEISLGGLG